MFWRIGDFPELDHLDPQQRSALLARVPGGTYPAMVLRAVVIASIASGVILRSLHLSFPDVEGAAKVAWFVSFPIFLAGGYLYQISRVRRVTRRAIADALDGERPPFCFACGYDLRGSDAVRCPECGGAVAVNRVDQR
jgi:hypothetical protein